MRLQFTQGVALADAAADAAAQPDIEEVEGAGGEAPACPLCLCSRKQVCFICLLCRCVASCSLCYVGHEFSPVGCYHTTQMIFSSIRRRHARHVGMYFVGGVLLVCTARIACKNLRAIGVDSVF
jgi:hypothetical protein